MDPKPQEPANNTNPDSTVANVDDGNAHDTSKPDEKKAHANFTTKQREWMLAALVAGRDHSEPMTSCLKTDTIDRAKLFLKRWKIHTTLTTTPSSNSLRSLWKTFFNPNKTIAKVRAGGRPRKVVSSDTEVDGEKRPKTKKRKVSQRNPRKPGSNVTKDRPVTAGRKQKKPETS